jgi:hypothetical protein
MSDDSTDVAAALAVFQREGLDPTLINVPAIAAAEGRSCLEVAERTVRAHRVATQRDRELGQL